MVVELTNDMVARFAGGQIEIQNLNERYVYRGAIESITVVDVHDLGILKIRLKWMAKGEGMSGMSPIPARWVNETNRDYESPLINYGASDIGEGRLFLEFSLSNEVVTLFPAGGSVLDPSKVEGLSLT